MTTPKKRWMIAESLPESVSNELEQYPPILRQILYNRGQDTAAAAERYLRGMPPADNDPHLMLGMQEAVQRIQQAIRKNESIAIYGDYDVDGVTATALLTLALQKAGGRAFGYIPNRFEEGYGLNREALETLKAQDTRLVITVDCGIRSPDEVQFAQQIGMDMIITDHHHPAGSLPEAVAIVNPKQPGDDYPYKELAGVGLAYKLAQCVLEDEAAADQFLDLVALGSISDLVPLTGENRALVRAGLKLLQAPARQGIQALIGVCDLQAAQINAGHIGFLLGPRLNAAGRLDSALAALELLLCEDVQQAGLLAQQLDVQNRERQQLTRQVQEHAEQMAMAEGEEGLLLFAAHPEYNSGVVGLAASRLSERYYRPAIVATIGETTTRGSCRSIPEFHITDALDQCAELMAHHGGHAAAAGFTVPNRNLLELHDRLQQIATQQLAGVDLRPTLRADVEVPLSELRPEILTYQSWLEPTGNSNPQATFVSRRVKVVRSRAVGRDSAHLKLTVMDQGYTYDAIAFRQGEWDGHLPQEIDLMYTYEVNEYQGNSYLQLNVIDLKPSGTPDA